MFGLGLPELIVLFVIIFVLVMFFRPKRAGINVEKPVAFDKENVGNTTIDSKKEGMIEVGFQENEQARRNELAMEQYNQGVLAAELKQFDLATQEYEKALEYNPDPECLMLILSNYAMCIWLKNRFNERRGDSISDEDYEDVKKVLKIYQRIIFIYENIDNVNTISCPFPLSDIYNNAKNNLGAFALYGSTKLDKNGNRHLRNV